VTGTFYNTERVHEKLSAKASRRCRNAGSHLHLNGHLMTLPEPLYDEIVRLCEAGNSHCDNDDFEAALEAFRSAAALLPEPKTDWEAATWVYTAIGDALFFLDDYTQALEALQIAVVSPDGLGNPFIHLRLGQCHYELGNHTQAADDLTRAYMSEGAEIFQSDDPKYFEFLTTQIRLD